MARSTFVYVTYIRTTPQKLWSALTDAEFMKQYCTSPSSRPRVILGNYRRGRSRGRDSVGGY
jgi:uncharacterized protein YndB with AHSA1/START domain